LFALDHEVDLNTAPLPFDAAAFDTVLLSDVLEHIAEPDQLIGEIARILRPGGALILGVPFLYPIHEQPYDFHRYTQYKLEHFASKHGFAIVELGPVGGASDVWTDISCKILSAIWTPLAILPYYGWRFLRAIPAVRRANEKVAWKMPLAYLAVYVKQ
jgi:SAM-dependent methyltransferase